MASPATPWLIYAIASGGCAALNGAFAKLTTTKLTTRWATTSSHFFGTDDKSIVFEVIIRGLFFAMNLVFNGVMWGLFTRALTLSNSTVRVSVINTSANFMLTALLGAVIFSEELPGLWWLGAGLLVAGSVIIGKRDEGADAGSPVDVKESTDETPLDPAGTTSSLDARLVTSGSNAKTSNGLKKRKYG